MHVSFNCQQAVPWHQERSLCPKSYVKLQRNYSPEDLHAGLCVWVERRLEAQLGQPQAREEQVQRADEVAQRDASVADHTCVHSNNMRI